MRTMAKPMLPPEDERERVIFDRLMEARQENRPISRHQLSDELARKKGMTPKDAFALVEAYCDEEAPAVPEYLGSEFAAPYLKTLALIGAVFALTVTIVSATRWWQGNRQFEWGFLIGLVAFGFAGWQWLRSLMRERATEAKA